MNLLMSSQQTKHLCQSLFSNKVAGLWLMACNFIKKETLALVFSCEFCEISKNTFFKERLWTTASGDHQNKKINLCMLNSFMGFHLSIYFFNGKITSSPYLETLLISMIKLLFFFFLSVIAMFDVASCNLWRL